MTPMTEMFANIGNETAYDNRTNLHRVTPSDISAEKDASHLSGLLDFEPKTDQQLSQNYDDPFIEENLELLDMAVAPHHPDPTTTNHLSQVKHSSDDDVYADYNSNQVFPSSHSARVRRQVRSTENKSSPNDFKPNSITTLGASTPRTVLLTTFSHPTPDASRKTEPAGVEDQNAIQEPQTTRRPKINRGVRPADNTYDEAVYYNVKEGGEEGAAAQDEDEAEQDFQHVDKVLYRLLPLIVHSISGAVCYYFSRIACKLCMQGFSYSLPLTLITPGGFKEHFKLLNKLNEITIYAGFYHNLTGTLFGSELRNSYICFYFGSI